MESLTIAVSMTTVWSEPNVASQHENVFLPDKYFGEHLRAHSKTSNGNKQTSVGYRECEKRSSNYAKKWNY